MRALILFSSIAIALCAVGNARADSGPEDSHSIEHHLKAIDVDGGITWFLQATDGAATNITALSYSLDLSMQAPVTKHGKVVIALEAGDGKGIDPVISPLSNANYDAFYTNLISASPDSTNVVVPSVSQAYYEGQYFGGKLVTDIGKLDVHSQFDDNAYANDETDQFMSAMFVRSAGTSYAELDEYYAPGISLLYSASDKIDLSFIAANGNGDGFNNIFDYAYVVGQINFKPHLGGRDGNYRLYALHDSRYKAYTEINSGKTTSNTAWGLSLDQSVAEGIGVFARFSSQDDGIAQNTVKGAWSLGTLLEGTLWGRNLDTIGIGYGSVNLNDKVDLATALGAKNTNDETHTEIFYKFGFSNEFTLTADAQVITKIGGNASADTVTVVGIRGQLNF